MAELMTREGLLSALDSERAALEQVVGRLSEAGWRAATRADGWTAHDIAAHLADSNYGLALMALGEIKPALPLTDSGWMDVDDYNQQRREKNAALPREKVVARLATSFDHARRAIETVPDYEAPGPYGPVHTVGMWLRRIVEHTRIHREDLAALADQ
jgi:uncharacterized protein (TIGR03083 family)